MVNQWIKFEISSFSCSGDILRKTENLMSHMTITTPFLGWFIIVLEYWMYWWNQILRFLSLLLSSSPADGRHFHVRCLGRRGSASSHSHLLLFFLCSLQLEGSGSKPNTWDLHLHWPHSAESCARLQGLISEDEERWTSKQIQPAPPILRHDIIIHLARLSISTTRVTCGILTDLIRNFWSSEYTALVAVSSCLYRHEKRIVRPHYVRHSSLRPWMPCDVIGILSVIEQ